jgi:ATP-dependent Lhr-like helicase
MQPLELFHPLIQKWFREQVGTPTRIQELAWPLIAEGRNVLVTAPTGSGKTLAAFLWGLNQLITGTWPGGRLRMLYISPLKALNNDVRRNLLKPLFELEQVFREASAPFPAIRVLTRSGDTPGDERQKMLRQPPEILITTPESLNILLTAKSSRPLLTSIATVILDEIHAVVASKRGTHLMTACDRLVPLADEFQRIALSATVRPMDEVAKFVAGYRMTGQGPTTQYHPRPIDLVRSEESKHYEVAIRFPSTVPPEATLDRETWWPALIADFKQIIRAHHSTLFFANSRRMAEKITRLINENEPQELAYAHHGSLSREIRLAVEEKLKRGELKAIVATNSLELGIDIGDLDQVVLIMTPFSVASAIQRIGRSGHLVGETSRGTLFPLHGRDFLNAAVVSRAIQDHDIEAVKPIRNPLDVLAQVILSMTAAEHWDVDALFAFLRAGYVYHDLTRKQFDLVLEMLAGRYADSRIRELKPRIYLDRIDNQVQAREGSSLLLYLSGGTIPDRGYFDLRLQDSRAKIGELDEEFVWERRLGETFALGTQLWRIQKITHNEVEVVPSQDRLGIIPFWKAEELNRDFYLSEKIACFLEDADSRLDDPAFATELRQRYGMDPQAAEALLEFLQGQKEATRQALPHRHHLLIEHFQDPMNQSDRKQVILHTFWGGRVNEPLAFALSRAWEETYHYPLEVIHTNDALLLILPHDFRPSELFTLITPDNVESWLQKALEETGFFGARFRENAERALLLPKSTFKRRMPLWLNRLRSKKLLDAVRHYGEFPIILETWRTCLQDEFDLDDLKAVLDEIQDGRIQVSEAVTSTASPMAADLIWKQTNKYMYEDDDLPAGRRAGLSEELMQELLQASHLRPRIPEDMIRSLNEKLKRTAAGYTPASSHELLDWVKERLLFPENEWRDLIMAIERDSPGDSGSFQDAIREKILWVHLPGAIAPLLAGREMLARLREVFPNLDPAGQAAEKPEEAWTLADFLDQWLVFYGPVETRWVRETLGLELEAFNQAARELMDNQQAIVDQFGETSRTEEMCNITNLEILLRMVRRSRQPAFEPLALAKLPLFLAVFQGLTPRGQNVEDLQQRLEQLFGWPALAPAWEDYLLPSRMQPYYTAWLDSLMQASDLIWFGCGLFKISLCFLQDLELFQITESGLAEAKALIPDNRGKFSFRDLVQAAGSEPAEAVEKIWSLAWKGRITNDTFLAIRKGVLNRFSSDHISLGTSPLASRRSAFSRWQSSRPMEGHWYRIDPPAEKKDRLGQEEQVKDRIRQLFRRYGILFRELLTRELPFMQWRAIFRNLRLMEFSGEVLTGHFFEGIPGLQFISHESFRMLQKPLPEEAVYWVNALDPASLCGVPLAGLKAVLPSRLASTHLVYQGSQLVLVSKRGGKLLEIQAPPDHPRLQDYFGLFKDLVTREFHPESKISVEKINDQAALNSPYAAALRRAGFKSSGVALELWKGY